MDKWPLPTGWAWKPLAEIASLNAVQIRPSDVPDEEFNYLGLEAVSSGAWIEPGPNSVRGNDIKSTCHRFDVRHVLYAKLRPYLNKVVVPTRAGICTTEFVPLVPDQQVIRREYLAAFLRTPDFVDYATRNSTGARMPRVRMDALWQASVPIPFPNDPARSLETQRRIVARLDALFAELAEARAVHASIQDDTATLMDAARSDVFSELAHNAPLVKLDSIAESRLGKMLSQASKKGSQSRPYLRNANVLWDEFKLDDLYEMDFTLEEREKYSLRPGDLLICEGGDVGRTAVWEAQVQDCYFQKALHRVRLNDSMAQPRYLMHFMAWIARSGSLAGLKTGSAIPHLTGIRLSKLDVVWPDPQVQKRVVSQLDAVKAQVTEMQRIQESAGAMLDKLGQAILSQAFRGELV